MNAFKSDRKFSVDLLMKQLIMYELKDVVILS